MREAPPPRLSQFVAPRCVHLLVFGRGHGHFSPVLGYLPAEDLVFVGDVNASYRPWLVPTTRLFDAQNTIDSSSHAKRGVLEVEAQ